MSFLTRSRICPREASTAYCRARNVFKVLVLVGLSTISRFLATVPLNASGGLQYFSRSQSAGDRPGPREPHRDAPQGGARQAGLALVLPPATRRHSRRACGGGSGGWGSTEAL